MPYSLEPVKWSSKNTVFVISERLQKLFSGLTKRIVERRAESSTCVLHVRPAVLRPCNMKQARWLCSSMALQHKGHKTSRTRNTKTSSLNPFCLKCKDRFLKEFGYSFLIILYFSSKQTAALDSVQLLCSQTYPKKNKKSLVYLGPERKLRLAVNILNSFLFFLFMWS